MNVSVPYNINIIEVDIPASKSYAQRAIIAAFLSRGECHIKNIGCSDDVLNLLEALAELGMKANVFEENLSVFQSDETTKQIGLVNCGESGLGVRLTIPVAATLGENISISGKGSLMLRSMIEFEEILPQLGVECQTENGLLPINISGKLRGGKVSLDGSRSSQFLSGLLMALPVSDEPSTLIVENLKSKPYIDITIDILSKFGVEVTHQNYQTFSIAGGQHYRATDLSIEGDWSGASIWAVYGAIKGIKINGLNQFSHQSDRRILDALQKCGVHYNWIDKQLEIKPSSVQTFEFDATDCPDLFPALVVLAAAAKGKSEIKGLGRLAHKESARGKVLQQEFKNLGLKIELTGDKMLIYGTGTLKSGTVSSHNDHRIAMAGALAAILSPNGTTICQAEAVSKSYPTFWEELLDK